jgi:hypothetical protein
MKSFLLETLEKIKLLPIGDAILYCYVHLLININRQKCL